MATRKAYKTITCNYHAIKHNERRKKGMKLITDFRRNELKVYDTNDRKQPYYSVKNFIRGILFSAIVDSYIVFHQDSEERRALDFYLNECL